jgi:hypothetical protein
MGVMADTAVDELQKANHRLILLNALNSNWKISLAYFLIYSLDAKERANLVCMLLDDNGWCACKYFYGGEIGRHMHLIIVHISIIQCHATSCLYL